MSGFAQAPLRKGGSDPRAASIVSGVFFLSGSLLVFLSLILPHPAATNVLALAVIAATGTLIGAACIAGAAYARSWSLHVLLATATVLVSMCVYFAGIVTGIYSMMFVWVVLVAAAFFTRPAVAAHVAWILVCWAATLIVVDDGSAFSTVTRWVLGGLVLSVTAAVVAEIVAGRRAMEQRLRAENEEKTRLQIELRHLADHDPLTGLANRRRLDHELARELSRAARQHTSLCVIALDLDRFKAYNDIHGHALGDGLLKLSAGAWDDVLRPADLLARTGGDEFVVLLPHCSLTGAESVARRLCEVVPLGQSCSAGLACWDGSEPAERLLTRADRAMYEAKQAVEAPAEHADPLPAADGG